MRELALRSGAMLGLVLCEARGAGPDFAHEVVPVLREYCAECHTGGKAKGGLSMNTRASLLRGGENGPVVVPGDAQASKLMKLVATEDEEDRMPPKGRRVPPEKIAILGAWIEDGLTWEEGFAFRKPAYEPPLKPRRPEIPKAVAGRTHPVDCLLDHWLATNRRKRPEPVGDAEFLRRASLDITGLLPGPERLKAFVADRSAGKRADAIRDLLADDTAYAEHWLTFWNDLLRNDYAGTGYIDGGRKQISAWLYRALVDNKPYDRFARELLSPSAESEGFARGIKWRGTVSAAQSVPVQFAQSVGQSFLGINLKCASCHDSFVDRWKLSESYGLAAIYAAEPLELYRCDKATGRMATPSWLFPELGNVDPGQPPAERLRQLAALMTDPQNGLFSRAIVNRIWHRLMGRGIVHPVDAMQGEPWNADLLDHLATRFTEDGCDLRKFIAYVCTSQAYQSKAEVAADAPASAGYAYAGPRAKRMTAEQFVDAVWQITGTAPAKFDAPISRGKPDPAAAGRVALQARWIWSSDGPTAPAAGERITLRKVVELPADALAAGAAVTADNGWSLFVNGRMAGSGNEWSRPVAVSLREHLRQGANEFLLVATNGGSAPNPAGAWFEARIRFAKAGQVTVASDASWEWTDRTPDGKGRFKAAPAAWRPAVAVANQQTWAAAEEGLKVALAVSEGGSSAMVRASLVKSDLLQRSLGRPNREQIVSMRPNDLTTLEAMDLNNGRILDGWLARGAGHLLARNFESADALTRWLYGYALSREPTRGELALARDALGEKPDARRVQDLLWAVLMLPEFQLVR